MIRPHYNVTVSLHPENTLAVVRISGVDANLSAFAFKFSISQCGGKSPLQYAKIMRRVMNVIEAANLYPNREPAEGPKQPDEVVFSMGPSNANA